MTTDAVSKSRAVAIAGQLALTGVLCCLLLAGTIGGPAFSASSGESSSEQGEADDTEVLASTAGRSFLKKSKSPSARPLAYQKTVPLNFLADIQRTRPVWEHDSRNGLGTPLRC